MIYSRSAKTVVVALTRCASQDTTHRVFCSTASASRTISNNWRFLSPPAASAALSRHEVWGWWGCGDVGMWGHTPEPRRPCPLGVQ
jgi:hypothetical protein